MFETTNPINQNAIIETVIIANKLEIRQAIQTLFGVKVTGVWTSNHRGKEKRVGKSIGRKPHWKRAIVKLADGDKIEIFEG